MTGPWLAQSPRRRLHAMALVVVCAWLIPNQESGVLAATPALGHVHYIHRGLTVRPPRRKPSKGNVRQALFAAYALQTRSLQRASISFADGTILHIDQQTNAVLRSTSLTMVRHGQVDEVVSPGTSHTVQTAAAAAAIGTNFDVKVKGKFTTVVWTCSHDR